MVNSGTMVHNSNDTGTMRSPGGGAQSYEAGTMVFNQSTMSAAQEAYETSGGPGDSGTMVLHSTSSTAQPSKGKPPAPSALNDASKPAVAGAVPRPGYEEPSYMRHIREASSKYGGKAGGGSQTGTMVVPPPGHAVGSSSSSAAAAAPAVAATPPPPQPVTSSSEFKDLYKHQLRFTPAQLDGLSLADLKASISQLEKSMSAEKAAMEAMYSEQKKQLKQMMEKKEKKK